MIEPLKLLPVRCNYCDGLPTEHTETCPETAMRRLATENELLRAKCAEGFYILRRMVKTNEERHPIGDALMRLARSFVKRGNPGQALLRYVEALETLARETLDHFHYCQDAWLYKLAKEALAACEDGQEELK